MNRWALCMVLGVALTLGLAACEEDTTDSGLKFSAASGGTVSPDGTWVGACEDDGGSDGQIITAVISGGSQTLTFSTYAGDLICSGASTDETYDIELETDGEKQATWEGAAPNSLPATVTVTKIVQTVPTNPTLSGLNIVIIDDTVDPWQLFSARPDMGIPTDTEGYPTQLAGAALTKQ